MVKTFEEKVFDELKLINHSISDLQKETSEMKIAISDLQKETSEMKIAISDLQHKTDVMKDSIILIEQKVTTELPALFDGYSMEHDIQGIHQNAINSLNQKVDNHDIRISILEQKAL